MYFILSLIVTGILGYFLPQWLYNLTWQEMTGVLSGQYDNDFIKSLDIIKKVGLQDDYNAFFQEKMFICIAITLAIFIGMLIITSIIKKAIQK